LLIGLFFWFILGVSPFGYCKTIKIPVKKSKKYCLLFFKKVKIYDGEQKG